MTYVLNLNVLNARPWLGGNHPSPPLCIDVIKVTLQYSESESMHPVASCIFWLIITLTAIAALDLIIHSNSLDNQRE
jgi:hypothetical protein